MSRSELEQLAQTYDEWHVSVYMPTYKEGDKVLQNAVRFGNLLDQAEEQLVEGGMRPLDAKALLSPARALVDDDLFWQHQSDGLAVFIAQGLARKYQLPLTFEDLVVVGDRFHLKPLLSVLSNKGRFYVLALSQHETRLFQGTRHRIGRVNLDDREQVPESIMEVLKWEDPEKRLQFHTGSEAVLDGGVAAVFHGHGVASQDDAEERILRYFHRLDQGIVDLLEGDDALLVLAADGFLLPLYRKANSYPHLVDEGIATQPSELEAEELHRRAWPIVQPLFSQAQEQAEATCRHLAGTEAEPVSDDLEEIVPAAVFDRVAALSVAQEEQHGTVQMREPQQPHGPAHASARDLLDVAAVETMLHEGWLFVVENQAVPGEGPLAAVLRW